MLKSYEAIMENGRIRWLTEQPESQSARVIVTILGAVELSKKRRIFPTEMMGKVEILGDIVSPIVDQEDWECLK